MELQILMCSPYLFGGDNERFGKNVTYQKLHVMQTSVPRTFSIQSFKIFVYG